MMYEPSLQDITNTGKQMEDSDTKRNLPVTVATEPSKKRVKYECNQQDAAQRPELEMYTQLKHVLGAYYFDVRQRLSLHHTPRCLWNVAHCRTNHVKRRTQPVRCISSVGTSYIKDQIMEQRPNQFAALIENTLAQRIFIGQELFTAALELILTMNPVSEGLQEDYSVDDVIRRTVDALETCLDLFPPCRYDLRRAYGELLVGRLEADCFDRYVSRSELFPTVLSMLEDAIKYDRSAASDKSRLRPTEKTPSMYQSFNAWVKNNTQRYDFDHLLRNDQLERIFLVLHLLIKVMEDNLAIWMLRLPWKIAPDLPTQYRSPLIVSLFWKDDHIISINKMVQQVTEIFVNAVALQYPKKDVEVLSRLMNLIAIVFELSTLTIEANAISFPKINANTQRFAEQIWITMQASSYFSTHCCLDVIESIRTPVVRLLLTESLCHKLNQRSFARSVHGYYQHIRERSWEECTVKEQSVPAPKTRYPVLDHKKTKKSCHGISEIQYVNLLLIGFQAYCDLHQIPAFYRAMLRKAPDVASPDERCTPSAHIIVANVPDSLMLHDLSVDSQLVLQYREDLKHLVLLSDHLRQLEAPDARLLERWRKYLGEIDGSQL